MSDNHDPELRAWGDVAEKQRARIAALEEALRALKYEIDHGTDLLGHMTRYDCPNERVQSRCPIHDAFGLLDAQNTASAQVKDCEQ